MNKYSTPEFLARLSCKDCYKRDNCPYTDDPYNTDGDCLANK